MPCRTDPYPCRTKGCPLEQGHKGDCPTQKTIDKLKKAAEKKAVEPSISEVVLLCSACRVLERTGYDFEENPALSLWWDEHKKKDKRR